MSRAVITMVILLGTALAFAVPLREWWLRRRIGRKARRRVGGREYKVRRK